LESLSDPAIWREIDVLIHCGWSSVPLTAERHPENLQRLDLPFLQDMLQASEQAGTHLHWVFLSTGAVYGDTGSEPARETRDPQPLGAYARGKWEAEKILTAAAAERASILRVSNLLGEHPNLTRPQGILPRLIHAAKADEEIVLWGDGQATK